MSIQYYVSYEGCNWVKVKAHSLSGAKIAAKRSCPFVGVSMRVGVKGEDGIKAVAVNRCDPITQKCGRWTEL